MVVDESNSADLRTPLKTDTPNSQSDANRTFATPGSTTMQNVRRMERSPWPTRSQTADVRRRDLNNPSSSHALDKQRVIELSLRLRQSHGKLAEATSALEAAVAEVRRLHKENEVLNLTYSPHEVPPPMFYNLAFVSGSAKSSGSRIGQANQCSSRERSSSFTTTRS